MELRDVRALVSLEGERVGTSAVSRRDGPASCLSCRPYSEDRRRSGFLRCDSGLE